MTDFIEYKGKHYEAMSASRRPDGPLVLECTELGNRDGLYFEVERQSNGTLVVVAASGEVPDVLAAKAIALAENEI